MEYQIIDNLLPANIFNNIKTQIMSDEFPFYYNDGITDKSGTQTDDFYFTHTMYNNNKPQSNFLTLVDPILNKINMRSLLRVKCNLYPNVGKSVKHPLHMDYNFEHKTAIFYLNTNNGATYFSDGSKVDAVQNRLVLFNGLTFHCSSLCTDKKIRVNININYL